MESYAVGLDILYELYCNKKPPLDHSEELVLNTVGLCSSQSAITCAELK